MVTLNHLGMLRAFSSDAIRQPGPLAPRRSRVDAHVRARRRAHRRPRRSARRIPASRRRRCPGSSSASGSRRKDESGPARDCACNSRRCGMVTALVAFHDGTAECVALGGSGAGEPGPGDRPTASARCGGPSTWTSSRGSSSGTARSCGRRAAIEWRHAIDDYDWEALGGGGFAALDPADGRVVVRGRFPEDLAWGNGGVAVVLRARRTVRHRTPGRAVHVRHARRQRRSRPAPPIADALARHRACRGRGRSGAVRLQSRRLPPPRDAGSPVQLEALIRHEALAAGPHIVEECLQRRLQERELLVQHRQPRRVEVAVDAF